MSDADDNLVQQLVYEAAVTILETKAAHLRRQLDDATLEAQAMERWERWRSDLSAIRQRHDMEQKARARGERVPRLSSDPEAYAAWLQRQRVLPYVELARDLNERSRRGLQ